MYTRWYTAGSVSAITWLSVSSMHEPKFGPTAPVSSIYYITDKGLSQSIIHVLSYATISPHKEVNGSTAVVVVSK